MKRDAAQNNIYYIFKPSSKTNKRRYFEDVFVPKFFINLYNLSRKKKITKDESKKYEDKDYLLNINSYFKPEQVSTLNTYNTNINNNNINTGSKSVKNKNLKINKRLFSANLKRLPKIRYTANDILYGNYNYSKRIESLKNIKYKNDLSKNNITRKRALSSSNKKSKENLSKKDIKKEKNAKNNRILKNMKFKINENKVSKNNSVNNSKNKIKNKEIGSNIDEKIMKSRNEKSLPNKIEEGKSKNVHSVKNNSVFNVSNFHFNIKNNKYKYCNFNKSITKSKITRKFNFFLKDKKNKNEEKDFSKASDLSKSKITKNSIQNLKTGNQPLKLKNSFLLMDNYCIFNKKKVAPKLSQIAKVNDFKVKYKSETEIISNISVIKIEYVLLNNNLLFPNEKFYFYINKRYRAQLTNYMKHRINWEYNSPNYTDETINFEWKYFSNKVNFKKFRYDYNTPLKKLKMINLFEKNYEIGNKKNMFINLITYCDQIGYNIFDVVPFTLIISNSKDLEYSFNALKELMQFLPKEKSQNNNIITNRKYNEHFWYDKNYEYINMQYINFNKNFISDKNYWIMKPPDLYQGKCIEICNNFEEIQKKCKKMFKGVDKTIIAELEDEEISYDDDDEDENEYEDIYAKKPTKFYCCNDIIIQKYLDNPLLYHNRKFDIRCFVLIDSNLNVYFCKEGHLKGCSEFYDLNKTNKFIHITNYSFQKNSSNFEKFEIGNEISYNDFKKFLKKEGIPLHKFDDMINQMKYLIKLSFKAVSNKLIKINPVLCFEIFGYDFIIDNDFKPWILEINDNPGLCISSPVIEKLIPRMLDDAFRLTIDKVFNTKYSADCFDSYGKYKSKFRLDGFNNNENIFEFICNLN